MMPHREACMCREALGYQLYCLNVVDGVRVTSSDKNTSTISSSFRQYLSLLPLNPTKLLTALL